MESVKPDYNKLARRPKEWAKAAQQNRKAIAEKWHVPVIVNEPPIIPPIVISHLSPIHNDKAFIKWEAKCKD